MSLSNLLPSTIALTQLKIYLLPMTKTSACRVEVPLIILTGTGCENCSWNSELDPESHGETKGTADDICGKLLESLSEAVLERLRRRRTSNRRMRAHQRRWLDSLIRSFEAEASQVSEADPPLIYKVSLTFEEWNHPVQPSSSSHSSRP